MSDASSREYGRRRRLGCWLTVALVVAAAWGLLRVFEGPISVRTRGWCYGRAFDAEEWRSAIAAGSLDNPRGAMIGDLTRRYQLRGMPRQRILQLLGPPTGVNHFLRGGREDEATATAQEFDYALGAYAGFQIDEDVLVIRFGRGDVVARWWLVGT